MTRLTKVAAGYYTKGRFLIVKVGPVWQLRGTDSETGDERWLQSYASLCEAREGLEWNLEAERSPR